MLEEMLISSSRQVQDGGEETKLSKPYPESGVNICIRLTSSRQADTNSSRVTTPSELTSIFLNISAALCSAVSEGPFR